MERTRLHPPSHQKSVGDELQRRVIDGALLGVEQFGEVLIDTLVFLHRRLQLKRAIDVELRAAMGQAQLSAVRRLDIDVPALIALLAPVELGAEFR
jgi:hypothetical protein